MINEVTANSKLYEKVDTLLSTYLYSLRFLKKLLTRTILLNKIFGSSAKSRTRDVEVRYCFLAV